MALRFLLNKSAECCLARLKTAWISLPPALDNNSLAVNTFEHWRKNYLFSLRRTLSIQEREDCDEETKDLLHALMNDGVTPRLTDNEISPLDKND